MRAIGTIITFSYERPEEIPEDAVEAEVTEGGKIRVTCNEAGDATFVVE